MAAQPLRLLVVDDDDVDRERLRRACSALARPLSIQEASSARDALDQLRDGAFDCVLLDHYLGDASGLELIGRARAHRGRKCAVIMVSGKGDERAVVRAMRAGACDYLPKRALGAAELVSAVDHGLRAVARDERRDAARRRLRRLGYYDGLTGLANRAQFLDRLAHACAMLDRGGAPFAVMVMDLDRFKQVNDTLGHAAGDVLLAEVGVRLRAVARATDVHARIGGDEFAAILPGVDGDDRALAMACRVCDTLAPEVMIDGQAVRPRAAVGVAVAPRDGASAETLIAAADRAMYRAKHRGLGVAIHDRPDT